MSSHCQQHFIEGSVEYINWESGDLHARESLCSEVDWIEHLASDGVLGFYEPPKKIFTITDLFFAALNTWTGQLRLLAIF